MKNGLKLLVLAFATSAVTSCSGPNNQEQKTIDSLAKVTKQDFKDAFSAVKINEAKNYDRRSQTTSEILAEYESEMNEKNADLRLKFLTRTVGHSTDIVGVQENVKLNGKTFPVITRYLNE